MSLWARIFAASYDRFFAAAERGALGDARQRLLAPLHGRVLELGAGTGANLPHYPDGADVVLTEPDPHMAKRLRAKAGHATVVDAGAEALPFADASFDVVVATLVFCTVPDVRASLREVRRVLAPGGRLLFIEHVRGEPGSKLEHWQERLHGPWHAFACGCNSNRDFLALLAEAGFVAEDVRHESWAIMPALIRPVVVGAAS
jgi:ubiquinone/menaquinone biosynthesis C-methylase UbiE